MSAYNWIKNNPLLQNIVPLVTGVFVGFSLLMLFILFSYTHNLTELEDVISNQAQKSLKMELNSQLMELARSRTRLTAKIINIEDPFEQDEINMQLDIHASQFARLRSTFLELDLSEIEKSIVEKQNKIIPKILTAQRKAVELAMSGEIKKIKSAQQILYDSVLPGQGQLIDLFAEMIVYEQKLIDQLSKNAKQSVKTMNDNSYRVIGFALLLIILVSTVVVIQIKKIQRDLLNSHKNLEKTVEKRTSELKQAVLSTEKAAKAKSQFLSTMSHEIRTPMNGVLGMAQLLESTKLDEVQRGYVQSTLNSADLLLTIINDILDFSKLEENKVKLESIDLNFEQLCLDVLNLLQKKCDEKGLQLQLNYPSNLPKYITSDPSRLRQILFNLLGNAIKFTEHGHVHLSIKSTEKKNDIITLQIAIEDTGIGISSDQINNLFQSFSQANESITREFGGTGLGLSICKQLVTLMGGEIHVDSEYGKGSIFYFDITVPIAEPAKEQSKDNTHNKPEITQAFIGHILLVDDVLTNQIIAKAMLENLGVTCDIAVDGNDAIEKWASNSYDLIFMDCRMPNMDGYEATRFIRANEDENQHIPIIALTANAEEDDRKKCISDGMDDVVIKPYEKSDLTNALLAWLKH